MKKESKYNYNYDLLSDVKRNKEPIHHVDATPNKHFPLRILKAYRENCNLFWSDSTDPTKEPKNPLWREMNNMQIQRAKILDEAIAVLEAHILEKRNTFEGE